MPKDALPNGDACAEGDLIDLVSVGPRRRVSEMQAKLHRWAAADPWSPVRRPVPQTWAQAA